MLRRPLLFVLAFSTLAAGGCTPPPGEDPALLFGRIWVDGKPEKPTDYRYGVFLLPRPSFGLFQRSSNYDFHFERFDYKRDGQALKLTFPQTGKTADVTFTVSSCQTLPGFDLCLDLSHNPWYGPTRYYGKRKIVDGDEASMRKLRDHLPTE